MSNKKAFTRIGLSVLAIAMIILGIAIPAPPPIVTGIGFALIAWGWE